MSNGSQRRAPCASTSRRRSLAKNSSAAIANSASAGLNTPRPFVSTAGPSDQLGHEHLVEAGRARVDPAQARRAPQDGREPRRAGPAVEQRVRLGRAVERLGLPAHDAAHARRRRLEHGQARVGRVGEDPEDHGATVNGSTRVTAAPVVSSRALSTSAYSPGSAPCRLMPSVRVRRPSAAAWIGVGCVSRTSVSPRSSFHPPTTRAGPAPGAP